LVSPNAKKFTSRIGTLPTDPFNASDADVVFLSRPTQRPA
jgi:hypothetical protein